MSHHLVARWICIPLGISERIKQLSFELSIKHKLCYTSLEHIFVLNRKLNQFIIVRWLQQKKKNKKKTSHLFEFK